MNVLSAETVLLFLALFFSGVVGWRLGGLWRDRGDAAGRAAYSLHRRPR
jgi:hypothetical protein